MAAVNVENGVYTNFDQTNMTFEDIADAAVASASIPMFFPPHNWEGRGIFMDGGTENNINLDSAINQCLDLVDDESKITIDILICGDNAPPEEWDSDGNGWSNFFRGDDLKKYYNNTDDIDRTMRTHPEINWRSVFVQGDSL